MITIFIIIAVLRGFLNASFPEIDFKELVESNPQNWALGAMISNLAMISLSAFIAILQNRYDTEKKQAQIKQEQQLAQLQFLRAQINPHFLFNTLNNIYYLAYTKSDKTADMVLRLSNLLRYVIYEGKASQVSLQKEKEHVELFIELFQMRNETPVNIIFESPGQINPKTLIEPMILIPIVENCFKHCNFETSDQAFIHLRLQMQGAFLHFNAINSKDELNQQKDKVGGVGLDNIRKRLALKYPDSYQLTINNQKDTFEINLQLKTIESNNDEV